MTEAGVSPIRTNARHRQALVVRLTRFVKTTTTGRDDVRADAGG